MDQEIPKDLQQQWDIWLTNLPAVRSHAIPRRYILIQAQFCSNHCTVSPTLQIWLMEQ